METITEPNAMSGTKDDLIEGHVALFNAGVRSADFGPMLERFTEDAELRFEGVPVGPFVGKDAIAAAYRTRPPDDEIEVLEMSAQEDKRVVDYAWRREPGKRAGRMMVTTLNGMISRLVVTFNPE